MLCVAAIAAIADAVARAAASDAPSPLSAFYGAHACAAVADGAEPFGFLPRDFAADTGRALLCDPDLVVARTALLDYFREIRRLVPPRNRVFDWEATAADDAAGDGGGALARLLLGARGAGQAPAGGLFLGLGDARLLDRLATSLGYAVAAGGANLPDYLAGRDGALLDDLPELRDLRDVVLVLKACTAATACWAAGAGGDAAPRWSRGGPRGGDERARREYRLAHFDARLCDAVGAPLRCGFLGGDADLATRPPGGDDSDDDDGGGGGRAPAGWRGALARVRAALAGYAAPRCPPSGGDPSHLAGELVATEDDVLHLPALPGDLGAAPRPSPGEARLLAGDAAAARAARLEAEAARLAAAGDGGALPPRDVERLLCYLTAPYLRLPLVLRFFADAVRVRSLRDARLRATLDAVLFECGAWLPAGAADDAVDAIPAPHRRLLRTPCGALFNELVMSPGPTCTAVARLLDLALGLDAGRWAPRGVAELVLFATRVAARALSFLAALDPAPARGGGLGRRGRAGLAAAPRGLEDPADGGDAARGVRGAALAGLRDALAGRAAPALRRWLPGLLAAGDRLGLRRACAVHAHALLVAAAVADAGGGDARGDVVALLGAQCFLGAYDDRADRDDVADDGDPAAAARRGEGPLGVDDGELAGVWQRQRLRVLGWLRAGLGAGGPAHGALEAVVDVVAAAARGRGAAAPGRAARAWAELDGFPGRFSPAEEAGDDRGDGDGDAAAAAAAAAPPAGGGGDGDDYGAHLRAALDRRGRRAEVVDVQLGEFSLRQRRLEALPRDVRDDADAAAALGGGGGGCGGDDPLRAAEVSSAALRRRWRLVGRRVDVVAWAPPPPPGGGDGLAPPPPFDVAALRPLARAGPREAWVGAALAPLLGDRAPLAGFALFLPRSFDAAAGFCAVVGFLDRGGARRWRECHAGRGGERGGAFVEVYEVAEHGRSWWRSLCYTSDAGRSLGAPRHSEDDFEDGGDCGCEAWPLARGHAGGRGAPAPSVDVSRRATRGGRAATRQTRVPDRHLRGLLPDALLDAYAFWRNADDASLCGYARAAPADAVVVVALDGAPARPRVVVTRRRVEPGAGGPDDAPPLPDGGAYGGLAVARGAPRTLLRVGGHGGHGVAARLARLDAAAHVLVWLAPAAGGALAVDAVELPRLGLALRRRGAALACAEYPGFDLAPRAALGAADDMDVPGDALALVAPLPSCLVLRDAESGATKVLCGGRGRPFRGPGGAAVLLDHGDARWAGNPGHVAFDVDAVGAALVPATPSAAVYLALCLFLADRLGDGPAAADLPARCVADGPRPPEVDAMLSALSGCGADRRGDAAAARVGLSLAALEAGCDGFLGADDWPWALAEELPLAVAARRTDAWLDDDACGPALDAALDARRPRGGLGFPADAVDAPARRAVANLRAGRRGEPWEPLPAAGDAGAPLEDPWAPLAWPEDRARRARAAGGGAPYARAAGFAGGDGLGPSLGLAGGRAVAWLRAHAGFRGAGDAPGAWTVRGAAGDAARGGAVDASPLGACYELLTAGLPFRVGDRDGGFGWGVALLHVLRGELAGAALDDGSALALACLGALAARAALCQGLGAAGRLPRYAPPARPKGVLESLAASGGDATARAVAALFAGAAAELRGAAARGELVAGPAPRQPGAPRREVLARAPPARRGAAPRAAVDLAAARRHLPDGARARVDAALVEASLGDGLPAGLLVAAPPRGGPAPLAAAPPYELPPSVVARYPTAAAHARRLRAAAGEDAAAEAARTVVHLAGLAPGAPPAWGAARAAAGRAAAALGAVAAADARAGRVARLALSRLANADGRDDDAASVAAWHGFAAAAGARRRGLGDALRGGAAGDAASLACVVALLRGRAAAARAARGRAARLAAAAGAASGAAAWRELVLEAAGLADALGERRRHFSRAGAGAYAYDAAALAAEAAMGLTLRGGQAAALAELAGRVERGESSLRQMIMGSGKTTVLTPALVARLADGERLVACVAPPALLVFTRAALERALGRAPLGPRPVATLDFGRRTFMGPGLLRRLRHVARRGGAVLASPTAVKALFLKSVEVAHRLDEALRCARDAAAEAAAAATRRRSTSAVAAFFGGGAARAREARAAAALGLDDGAAAAGAAAAGDDGYEQFASDAALRSLRAQARVAADVAGLLRRGVAVLDEVDVVLDPLKSELNWPLGAPAPLDFTEGDDPPGLRWRVPFLLLDAVVAAAAPGDVAAARVAAVLAARRAGRDARRDAGGDAGGDDDDDDDDLAVDDDALLHADGDELAEAAARPGGAAPPRGGGGGDDEGVASRLALAAARAAVDAAVADGLRRGALQARPHATLVSSAWYAAELRPALARRAAARPPRPDVGARATGRRAPAAPRALDESRRARSARGARRPAPAHRSTPRAGGSSRSCGRRRARRRSSPARPSPATSAASATTRCSRTSARRPPAAPTARPRPRASARAAATARRSSSTSTTRGSATSCPSRSAASTASTTASCPRATSRARARARPRPRRAARRPRARCPRRGGCSPCPSWARTARATRRSSATRTCSSGSRSSRCATRASATRTRSGSSATSSAASAPRPARPRAGPRRGPTRATSRAPAAPSGARAPAAAASGPSTRSTSATARWSAPRSRCCGGPSRAAATTSGGAASPRR